MNMEMQGVLMFLSGIVIGRLAWYGLQRSNRPWSKNVRRSRLADRVMDNAAWRREHVHPEQPNSLQS